MGKYENLAKEIVKNVGGKENIISLVHCITRLRFQLKDEGKANDDAVKNMDGVVTLMKSGGQYQVVIGNHVSDVFADVCTIADIKQESNNQPQGKKKKSVGGILLDYMSAIMNPIMGILCGVGILKGLLAILTITGILTESDGIYMLLYAASDSLFYFFPIFFGYTAAVKFNMTPLLGATIGAAMVYPAIQGLEDFSVFGIDLSGTSYTSTMIPIILVIMLAAPLERTLKKVIPDVIKTFIAPMLVLLICVPVGFIVIGPIANWISGIVAGALIGVYNISPILCGLLVGASYQVQVVFGIHGGLSVALMLDFLSNGSSALFALVCLPSFAQTAVVLVIWLKTKNQKLKNIALPAWISGIFGITEPAIYGVTLPRIKYFIISCIGAGIGCAYMGLTQVTLYQLTGLGVFSLPMTISPQASSGNLINYIIAIVIAIIVSGVATFILYKDEGNDLQATTNKSNNSSRTINICTPIAGTVIPLSEIKDDAFSQGVLGAGVVIEPKEGKVIAPEDGILMTLFPTNHALGIKMNSGAEILIHIGMDTVQLEGKYFTPKAKQGDTVKKGQVLMEFDLKAIKAAGYSLLTPVIITNTETYADVIETNDQTVSLGDNLIHIILKKEG